MRKIDDGLALVIGDDQERLGSSSRNLQPRRLTAGLVEILCHSGSVQNAVSGLETSIANVRLNVKSHYEALSLLEAGGIEPPSRDGSKCASTCIVGRLSLGSRCANRQAQQDPSQTVDSPRRGQASRHS